MATGFMRLHSISLCLLLAALPAVAAEVALIGVIGDKAAVLALDGGNPKTVKVGQTWSGVTVLAVKGDEATVQIDGRKRVLKQGQHYRAAAAPSDRQSVTLAADPRGHFMADGSVNGVSVRFLVDTGATAVSLPLAEAGRMGIDYRTGERIGLRTANGMTTGYRVRLDSVTVGAIELQGVEAVLVEKGLDTPLLGMSFLNRMEMRRDGDAMMLIRRF